MQDEGATSPKEGAVWSSMEGPFSEGVFVVGEPEDSRVFIKSRGGGKA